LALEICHNAFGSDKCIQLSGKCVGIVFLPIEASQCFVRLLKAVVYETLLTHISRRTSDSTVDADWDGQSIGG